MSMRLTLRTLLAYLDDTLEPAEAKLIGQKVAESDTAQELIARIKEVTRRRRITTPPAGGPGAKVDPNAIAGYLDNALSSEALAEVEQLALTSDVHLAEIAACHQILTIVLGEQATVPPTAYKRMYGLVKPPESNPEHKPPVARETEEGLAEGQEVDETLRLGLPALHGHGSWTNRLILIGGAVCVLALLSVAIWQLLAPLGSRESEGDSRAKLGTGAKTLPPGLVAEVKDKTPPKAGAETPGKKDNVAKDKKAEADKQPKAEGNLPDPKEIPPRASDKKAEDAAPAPPNLAERSLGQFEPPTPPANAVLLQLLADKKQPERKQWTRLLRTKDPAKVVSNAALVSLPGYHSVINMDSGVRLTLWGNVREIWDLPVAHESLVTLHPNDQFDLDLTLQRGRIAVANAKSQPAKIRLRFANPANPAKGEVWDMTLLEKDTEVLVNLTAFHPPGELFYTKPDDPHRLGPVAGVALVVVTGSADLKRDLQPAEKLLPPPAGSLFVWDSRSGRSNLIKAAAMPPWVQPLPPLPKDADSKPRAAMLAALSSLNTDLSGTAVDAGLIKAMASNDTAKRRLVVLSAVALDDLQRVIDALADKEPEVRLTAIEALRVWIAAKRDNDYVLFEQLQPTYSPTDATIILTLLHFFGQDQAADPATHKLLVEYLTNKKPAVRELAHDHLVRLFPSGKAIGFNAVAPEAQIQQSAKQWRDLVQKASQK
jgi:hypothetical protein